MEGIKIGVLGGGISEERAISLISASQVFNSLQRKGFSVTLIDLDTDKPRAIHALLRSHTLDLVFVALHGAFGEDGGVQRILEEMGLPYTGSGPQASRLAMDKVLSKEAFRSCGVPTPYAVVVGRGDDIPVMTAYPLVVKPASSGSSLGISIVRERALLKEALKEAFAYDDTVLIEEYVAGRELTVGIVGDKPLAVVEIIPKTGYYDFHAKYSDNLVDFVSPATLSREAYAQVQHVAFQAHHALGCRDFSRADIRLGVDGTPFVLEVNSIPGLTSHSLLPLSASCVGMNFDSLIVAMLTLAWKRKIHIQQG